MSPGAPAGQQTRSLVLDFDGTITDHDLLDEVARRFGDEEVYREVETGLDEGRLSLREVITREFAPVRAPLEQVVEWVLENARVRPGFGELVRLSRARGWRLTVMSSGFRELIEPVLAREGVEVEVQANSVEASPEGWRVHWRDGDSCDSCGEECKRAGLSAGEVVYVGDGYSDRCAALAADRVFATRGLAEYLDARGIPYEPFRDFFEIADALS